MTGTRTSAQLASVLAGIAVLVVLGTSVATVAAYTRRDDVGATATTTPTSGSKGHAFAHGQFVVGDRGDNAMFEVPAKADGWTTQTSHTVLYYVDRTGRPDVGVAGPAVFRDGYCRQEPNNSNLGFVGFTRSITGKGAREANAGLSRDWVKAISLNEDLSTSSPHTPIRTQPVTLSDGTDAVRSTSRITITDRGPCDAPTVDFSMVSFDTGEAVANLVMVRDVDAPGTLSDDLADQILGTARQVLD